jgi:hypothetical protein
MQASARILFPVAFVATTVGAVAGYSFRAPPAIPAFACRPAIASMHVSEASNTKAVGASTWRQQPSLMDTSWKHWPSLTDF